MKAIDNDELTNLKYNVSQKLPELVYTTYSFFFHGRQIRVENNRISVMSPTADDVVFVLDVETKEDQKLFSSLVTAIETKYVEMEFMELIR
jgi:hypothetical protein